MAETHSRSRLVRFGAFEADVQTGELRKNGVKLKFSGQPFQVLAILLERPGDELRGRSCRNASGRRRLSMWREISTLPSTRSGMC
jgi:DNA-binding response OmpR family regulator